MASSSVLQACYFIACLLAQINLQVDKIRSKRDNLAGSLATTTQFALYGSRIARAVEQTKYNDFRIDKSVINSIWETPQETAPKSTMNFRKQIWISRQIGTASVEHSKEVLAKTSRLI